MPENSVGSVSVDVVPDARRFPSRLAAQVNPAAARIGAQFGRLFGESAQKEMARGIAGGLGSGSPAAQGAKQGEQFGSAFTRSFKARIEAGLRALPDIKLSADSTDVDREILAIRRNLEVLRDKKIGIDIDAGNAVEQLTALRERLDRLGASSPNVQVKVDTATASAQLAAFQAEVDQLAALSPTVSPDVDGAAASGQLALLSGQASSTGAAFGGAGIAASLLGSLLAPLAATGAAAMGAIATGAISAAGGAGVLVLALTPVIGALLSVKQANDQSAQSARGSATSHLQVAAAMDAVRQAQRGLASAQEDARITEVRSAEQIKQAERSLADAERAAATDRVQDARKVADAKRALADAQRQAAADQVTAARNLVQAERSVSDAQKSALQAQRDLNDARRQAVQDAEDLANRVIDGQLGERDATLQLQQAQSDLADVMADPAASQAQRDQAQLTFDQATQRLREQQLENQRLADQKAASDTAGVDGSKAVLDAQDALLQSQQRLADAQQAAADAAARQAQQQQQAARQIAGAQQAVADAVQGAKDREAADLRTIADDHRKVADAASAAADSQRRSAEAIASAQQAVVAAQRGVQQASQSAGAAGGSALEDLHQKMAALTPAGQAFVTFLAGPFSAALKPIGEEAQTGVLPGLQRALQALTPLIPAFAGFVGKLAAVLGGLAEKAVAALGSPVWRDFFSYIGSAAGPIISTLARVLGNLVTGLAGILTALAPVTSAIFGALDRLAAGFAAFGSGAGGGLQTFIGYVQRIGPQVVATFLAIGGAVLNLVGAFAPLAPVVLFLIRLFANVIAALPPEAIYGIVIAIGIWAATIAALNLYAAAAAGWLLEVGSVTVPLGVAIFAVVAVFVAAAIAIRLLWEHCQTFRDVVTTVWQAIQDAVGTAWAFLQGIFASIVDYFQTTLIPLWQQQLLPAVEAAWITIRIVVAVAVAAIIIIFQLIKAYVTDVLIPLFTGVLLPALKVVWDGIVLVIKLAWALIRLVFVAIKAFVEDVLIPIFEFFWKHVIVPVWDGIEFVIKGAWAGIKVIFEAIKFVLETLVFPVFNFLLDHVIKPVWDGLHDKISTVWDLIKPIFTAFGGFISDHVVAPFQTGVQAIADAWGTVKDATKVPIKFVIETVINKGIIGTFNKVAGWFGLDGFAEVPLPAGFATGGYVSGPGGPREDLIPAMLSNGEFVINAAAVKKNLALIQAINAGADIGGDLGGVTRNRFADGGLVDQVKAWLPSVDPLPYQWGAVGPDAFDCSGLVGEVWARLNQKASNTRYFTTSSPMSSFGFAPGPGLFTIGVNPGEHMLGNLGGEGFEARSTATGIFVGPSATPPSSMQQQFHWSALPGGEDTPDGISLLHPIQSLRNLFGGLADKILAFSNTPLGHILAAIPGKIVDGLVQWVKDKVPGLADGGLVTPALMKYDNGGYLPPGLTTVLNATGKPEPVFTPAQFASLGRATEPSASGPIDVRVFVGDREITDIVRTEVRSAERATVAAFRAGAGTR